MTASRAELILSRRDVAFLLHDWLRVGGLLDRPCYADHSADTFDAALDLAEQIAVKYFANHNAASDRDEPRFDGERVHIRPEVAIALDAFARSGLLGAAMDEPVGGGQLPHVVHRACFAWLQAANAATAAYPLLTVANANLLCAYGTDDQIARYVVPMVAGRFSGTMCLSEPQAGSSLADVATTAVPEPGVPGRYRLTGNKMWISGGDHELTENIVHLVLARTAGPARGVRGLSLFIVPRFLVNDDGSRGARNDVVLAGINHKMGFRGTVNTLLNFGEGAHRPDGAPGAIGYLVGDEGQGLAQMFHMMNEARVAVGAGAAALAYTSYLHALDYARTRPQGRPVGRGDPATPQVPIVAHADVRRMLLASKSYAEGGLALALYAARLLDERITAPDVTARHEAALLLDVLTPIVKSWPSQWGLVANEHAIQVHGGYGYTREFPVEQFYRDNRLNSIHEGTFGIQAADLLGRKVRQQEGVGLRLLRGRILATADAAGPKWTVQASELRAAVDRLTEVTHVLWRDGDARVATANAGIYLEAAGHVVVAWIWLSMALATGSEDSAFHRGKRAAARYFFTHELPRTAPQFDLLASRDTSLVTLNDAWL
jgi:butyryl-CoA dehydrogenase